MHQTRCSSLDETESFEQGLPSQISDKDLDQHGSYLFSKILHYEFPKDFKGFERSSSDSAKSVGSAYGADSLDHITFIKLKHSYDIRAYVEFELDEAYFTMSLDELAKDSQGEFTAEESLLQAPL